MLLRNSISNTKKFFQKTIDNVKSFLTLGTTYQKLPKTPPFHPFSCVNDTIEINGDQTYDNNNDLDYFYTEFTNQWDSRKNKTKNKAQKKSSIHNSTKKTQQFSIDNSFQKQNCNTFSSRTEENMKNPEKIMKNPEKICDSEKKFEQKEELKRERFNLSPKIVMKKGEMCSRSVREQRISFVAEKLKELEVIDKGNVDHKLDFEEFLHYYSRLTCPTYLDIVDKFLMEMCREFLGTQISPNKVNYSRSMLQALKV